MNARWFAVCTLLACTPSNVLDAEKKGNVSWLVRNGTGEAVAALGRLADDDKSAQAALESMAQRTEEGKTLEGGATAVDVYLAAWDGVERNRAWASAMIKFALGDHARMEDAASAMKRGSPQLASFVGDLDAAIANHCGRCAAVLASASGAAATAAIASRLGDGRTREAMCEGVGSDGASKDARAVFTRAPVGSRDALACPGAAARMAARDDEALTWLASSAEPGLLRAAGSSDTMPCERLARLWSTALGSRDRAGYGALALPFGDAVKRCPKALDPTLASALASDAESQVLAVSAIDPMDVTARTTPLACTAVGKVTRGAAPPPTKARAADIAARCR